MLRGLSLTARLTVFFTGVAAFVVLGLGWLFMAEANQHFIELDRAALLDKKHLIEEVLANANSAEDARWRLDEALSHHHGLYAAVTDVRGAPLFQSSGYVAPEGAREISANREANVLQAWTTDGREIRMLRFDAKPKHNSETVLHITIAMDTVHHAQYLSDLRRSLSIYTIAAMLVSGLLGWFAAHQGLAPLRAMKARAAGVTGQQLGERMQVDAVPVEMAELAKELNRMLERLQIDFSRLKNFSSDLAHELRTPISNLLTQTQVTLSATRDVATYRDILASNAEELQRLARTVSDMLFLAKTERGVDLPNKERFRADHEVQALVEFYEAVAEEKHIRLYAQGNGDIYGDRLMFRRAVSNLLSNALRYAPEGSEVTITVECTGQATEVTVQNMGPEIAPNVLPRLFDRFYRADPARTHPESDGAGLGLSITKAISEAHGGTATVFSEQGMTRFTLSFPRQPELNS